MTSPTPARSIASCSRAREGVARSLRREGLAGRTIHLKVRTGDFKTATRALTLRDPADLAETIIDAVRAMYRERIDLEGKGVRLLGVGVSGLAPAVSVTGGYSWTTRSNAPGSTRAHPTL